MNTERIMELHRLLAEDPADAFLRHALALEHHALGDDDEAERQWLMVLLTAPDYVPTRHQLALLLAGKGRVEEALTHAREGLRAATNLKEHKAAGELLTLIDQLEDT